MQIAEHRMAMNASSLYYRHEEEELKISSPSPAEAAKSAENIAQQEDSLEGIDPKYRIMALLLEALTGEKIVPATFRARSGTPPSAAPATAISSSPIVEYRYQMEEHSRMDFSAQGSVRLEDGTMRTFSLSIQWEQHFSESLSLRMQDGKVMTDPLVISFDGSQPLSANAFAFNLTGKEGEKLPYLSGSAGYLARDLDGDGTVTEGSELFGPASGKGFMELSALDSDQNGWIDSGDSTFRQLRVWKITEQTESLLSLEQAGIGAISLQTAALGYTAKSDAETPIAHYKQASVALGETEGAYGVFEVDVAV